jgi:hypothetical protein
MLKTLRLLVLMERELILKHLVFLDLHLQRKNKILHGRAEIRSPIFYASKIIGIFIEVRFLMEALGNKSKGSDYIK